MRRRRLASGARDRRNQGERIMPGLDVRGPVQPASTGQVCDSCACCGMRTATMRQLHLIGTCGCNYLPSSVPLSFVAMLRIQHAQRFLCRPCSCLRRGLVSPVLGHSRLCPDLPPSPQPGAVEPPYHDHPHLLSSLRASVRRQAVGLRSRHSHDPWLSDMTPAPDDTLLPPGFGELRLTAGSLTLWGGADGTAACAPSGCSDTRPVWGFAHPSLLWLEDGMFPADRPITHVTGSPAWSLKPSN